MCPIDVFKSHSIIIIFFLLTLCIVSSLSSLSNSQKVPNLNLLSPLKEQAKEGVKDNVSSASTEQRNILIQNCRLFGGGWGKSKLNELFQILIQDGRIMQVDQTISATIPENVHIIDAKGRIITPGIIDVHTHIGVHSLPGLSASNDVNEKAEPIAPMMRAIDAFNPKDEAIHEMRNMGGITTAQVIPGSGNVMGGEGLIVKLKDTKNIDEMLVNGAPTPLKMACGENPKFDVGRTVPTVNRAMSRMGNAWLMRKTLEQAKNLIIEQDIWDQSKNENTRNRISTPRPSDLRLEALTKLLRHEHVVLNVHCYEIQDIEMIVRLSKEFNFTVSALHHAAEAHLIPDILKQNNIAAAIFADRFNAKWEVHSASVMAPKILHDNGVTVIIKSDHPVTHSKYLINNVAKAHYYGFDEVEAINSVTINAARMLKLDHRLGYLTPGHDADIVIWDRHPLKLGAKPEIVIIDGQVLTSAESANPDTNPSILSPNNDINILKGSCNQDEKYKVSNSYAIQGAKIYTMNAEEYGSLSQSVLESATIVVHNGNVTCIGVNCDLNGIEDIFEAKNGIITPGFISSTTSLCLVEIPAEPSTNDGTSVGFTSTSDPVLSKDGVRFHTLSFNAAVYAGVTASISHRYSNRLLNGVSSSFYLDPSSVTVSGAVIRDQTAVQFSLGYHTKQHVNSRYSISGQIAELRTIFERASKKSAEADPEDLFVRLLNRTIPAVVKVDQADMIDSLLDLQDEFQFRLIIVGGAEAHLVANRLARQDVSLILTPHTDSKSVGENFEMIRTSPDYQIGKLYASNVHLGIGVGSELSERNLRWIAGMLSQNGMGELNFVESLSLITRNVAKMFSLHTEGVGVIKANTKANFVLFDGNPLTFEGKPHILSIGKALSCSPQQY